MGPSDDADAADDAPASPSADATAAPGSPDPARRRGTPLLVAGLTLIGLFVLLAVVGTWTVVRAQQAATALTAARSGVAQIRDDLSHGRVTEAAAHLPAVQANTSRARRLTHDPVFTVLAHIPYLGDTPAAVAGVSATADDVATHVLPALVDAARHLDPTTLRGAHNRLDLAAIAAAQQPLGQATAGLTQAVATLDALDLAGTPGRVRDAVTGVRDDLAAARDEAQHAGDAASLAPALLGADGPRYYFLALQTNAEARGTGGLMGAWGVIRADHGKLSVVRLASRSVLDNQSYPGPARNLGADYRNLYGDDPGLWVNTNVSPHFPYAARLWLAMYADRTGHHLDGAIALDPVTLSYLLAATGPATLPDGEPVTADNVVALTESEVYARYPDNDHRRDAFLQQVARAAVSAVLSGQGDPAAMLDALGRAVGERRLLLYSAHADEQARVAPTAVSGVVPDAPGPFVGLALNNGGGNKLDYYLQPTLSYAADACPGPAAPTTGTAAATRRTHVDVTLTSTAPTHGLPLYVAERNDLPGRRHGQPLAHHGENLEYVSVFAAQGAQLVGATLDGHRVAPSIGTERGHPVYVFAVTLPAGQTQRLHLDLVEPDVGGPVRTFVTPLVKPTVVHADIPDCGVPTGVGTPIDHGSPTVGSPTGE